MTRFARTAADGPRGRKSSSCRATYFAKESVTSATSSSSWNIWNSTGAKARKADATVAGKEAHGFVLAAVLSAAQATVYFEGTNTQVSGQTPGTVYLQITAGLGGAVIPSAAGNVVQKVGLAISPTAVNFEGGEPVTLA